MRAFFPHCILALFLLGCAPPNSTNDTQNTKAANKSVNTIGSHQTTTLFDPLIHRWPHELSDIARDPNIIYGQLDNGLRYALRRNSRPESEAVLRFWVRAGSRNETDDTLGLAHFLEHMAFNGSENVPEGEMVKSLERLGLSFGADTNASTTFTRTEYVLNLPEVDDETLDYGLFLMRETADKLLITSDAVERERGVVKAEEARGNTPRRKAARAQTDFIYPDALARIRPVIGTPETLDSITAAQLRAFYDTHYRPERSLIVMVGDFDVDTIEEKIRTTFSDWVNDTPAPSDPDNGNVSKRPMDVQIYNDPELTTSLSAFDAYPSTYQMDTVKARRGNFIRGYANAIVNQRLRKILLAEDAPVLSAGISYASLQYGDQATAQIAAKDDNWQDGLAIIDREIRQALQYGFQQAEFNELVLNTRRSLTDSVNYAAKRRSGALASQIISGFANATVVTTPETTLERFEETVETVTLADLEDAFTAMWHNFEPLIWLQGPTLEDLDKSAVFTAYKTARSRMLAPPETREVLTFAYQNFGPPGQIVWENRIEDFDIDQYRFDNNVRLNLKKTDFEDDWIRITVTIGEGWSLFPEDKPGLSLLADNIALGGFEAHKASELSQIFAGKRVSLGMRIGQDRLNFSGSTNPDDVEDQFKVWTALLTAPGYRNEWPQKFYDSIEASFHTIDSTPGGVASRDLGRIWANGDRRYGMLEKDEYLAYTLDDVRAVLAPQFADAPIEIGVVGDLDTAAIIKSVAKTFGALSKRRLDFDVNPAPFKARFPDANRVTLTHTGAANQGAIYMGWPVPVSKPWTIERARLYGMVVNILQNRLIDIIREEKALAYSPGTGLSYSKLARDYGYVSASISADPQFFDTFEMTVKDIVADLRQSSITPDEVERALKPTLESFERSAKENGAWLSLVTQSQSKPERLGYRRSREAVFKGMNAAILNRAAKDLFTPDSLHVVTIVPDDSGP